MGSQTDGLQEFGNDGQGGGHGGRLDRVDDTSGASGKQVRGEDSKDDVGSGDGEGGSNDVRRKSTVRNSTDGRGDGGVHSGKGDNDTTRKRGRGNSGGVSERPKGGKKSSSKRDEIHRAVTREQAQKEFDEAVKEFRDILNEDFTEPIKGKLLAVDPISLYTALGVAKSIKLLIAGAKVAYKTICFPH